MKADLDRAACKVAANLLLTLLIPVAIFAVIGIGVVGFIIEILLNGERNGKG